MRGTRCTKYEVRLARYENALPSARPEALVGPSGATTHATARPHVILSDDHLPYAKSLLLREGIWGGADTCTRLEEISESLQGARNPRLLLRTSAFVLRFPRSPIANRR